MDNLLSQLHDIYSVYHIPFWQTTWFYWSCIIGGLVLLGITMLLLFRWYRRKKIKPLPYWQQTLHKITQLQMKQYRTKAEGKQCYFVLTAELKQYLDKRFKFEITTKTDDEAANYIQTQSLNNEHKAALLDIFKGCLHIKFANAQAIEQQIIKHLKCAENIILQTLPQKEYNEKVIS